MLQTNDRCRAVPMCSPLALLFRCLSNSTQRLRLEKSCRAGSAPCVRDLASTALDKARSYRSEVIDLCAADIIAMRSENALSLVTRSCRESLTVWSSQRVWQSQSLPSENPLCRRVPAVINGRVASPSDCGREPSHTMQLFRHKFDAELIKQSTRMCFPDSSMPFTDCVLLWSDGYCRHEFAPQIFELLSELTLEFSSLVVNQPSRYVRGVSWSELATVPKRKSRRSLDLNFSWNSEEDIWKVWKKSDGTKRKRRRVKRTTTTQRTNGHAWMG